MLSIRLVTLALASLFLGFEAESTEPPSGKPQSTDIVGAWLCGPYEMTGPDFVVTSLDRTTYTADGKVTSWSTFTVTKSDGTSIRNEMRSEGSWALTDDLIEVRYTLGKFLWSDSPTVSIARGQALLDAEDAKAEAAKKDVSKLRVLEYGERLVIVLVDGMYKEAEVVRTCSKA